MRVLVIIYGLVSYFLFFGTLVYFLGFVGDFFVPKFISSSASMPPLQALFVNIGLLLLWGIQHSVMAREGFKDYISNIIPAHTERSTYVLLSTLILAFLMYHWQPIEGIVWQVQEPILQTGLWFLFALGWLLVIVSTFLTDHFDLFGLRQTWLHFVKKTYSPVSFTERFLYRWIRHPMMSGLFLAFWALPTMTLGHLVFSIGMSLYILIGLHFEEKGLVKSLGVPYEDYQKRTAKIIPKVY